MRELVRALRAQLESFESEPPSPEEVLRRRHGITDHEMLRTWLQGSGPNQDRQELGPREMSDLRIARESLAMHADFLTRRPVSVRRFLVLWSHWVELSFRAMLGALPPSHDDLRPLAVEQAVDQTPAQLREVMQLWVSADNLFTREMSRQQPDYQRTVQYGDTFWPLLTQWRTAIARVTQGHWDALQGVAKAQRDVAGYLMAAALNTNRAQLEDAVGALRAVEDLWTNVESIYRARTPRLAQLEHHNSR